MPIQIRYINGTRFRRFIITSAERINQTEYHLNDINVFPVADGDTGTNLAITMNNIVQEVQNYQRKSFEDMMQRIAKSALIGARGNSGAILAQFFQGLAEATHGMSRLTTVHFSQAAVKAAEQASQAITNPREGTIITVMKDWAQYINLMAHKTPDFVELFKQSLHRARLSLLDTPNKLAVLKKAGVVDAGAEGFVNILEGIVEFIEYGKLKTLQQVDKHISSQSMKALFSSAGEKIRYRYCTECLLIGKKLDKERIKKMIQDLGDSQVVVGSSQQVRIHIHTNDPQVVFSRARSVGLISETKVDDMLEQVIMDKKKAKKQKIALVADSTCDLPVELIKKYHIELVPIAVQIGQDGFLDRINITTREVVNAMEQSAKRVTTSQPPYQYFEDAYERVGSENDIIISIHISGQLSGTYQAACVAARKSRYSDKIYVIDAKTSSVALGLLVLKAARLIEKGKTVTQIKKQLSRDIENNKIFVSVPTLKYLIKSGRLNRLKGLMGGIMRLKPVITLNSEGAFGEAAKVIGNRNLYHKTLELTCQFAETIEKPCFAIAHIGDIEQAKWYQKELKCSFPHSEILIAEGSPALSVHIGKGGTAIAIMSAE